MSNHPFTDPFRYTPHPLVKEAAEKIMDRIEASPDLADAFAEGKMLGVLVVKDKKGKTVFLAGFSGNVSGQSIIEGFVPPIFDLLDPDGNYKMQEAEISAINKQIRRLESSDRLLVLKNEKEEALRKMESDICRIKKDMACRKHERDNIRKSTSDPEALEQLLKESQFDKAQLRRARQAWEEKIQSIDTELSGLKEEILRLKDLRAERSDNLQKWIFRQYTVHNALGEQKSIWEIFSEKGLVPPGGTGECAAPKLLEHAYRNGLKPVAMGEFWYGKSPDTAVRTHGHFYPSCTSKCGPLLSFMMSGLEGRCMEGTFPPPGRGCLHQQAGVPGTHSLQDRRIIYEDDCIIMVDKPSGIPSVPGLDGRTSLLEWLNSHERQSSANTASVYEAVHRLDMDTSGIMVFAKTPEAAVNLRQQFEEHKVRKTYFARLAPAPEGRNLKPGDKGTIELPLSPDYDERPRQKVDMIQGKTAVTGYKVVAVNEDGTTDIFFHPLTGRTHQLRVHSAHTLGLGHPILGDMLYGGADNGCIRLHLHALSICFIHPATGEYLTFRTEDNPIQ